MEPGLAATGVIDLAIAYLMASIARRVHARHYVDELRSAGLAFASFWGLLGLLAALGGIEALLASTGGLTLALHASFLHLRLVAVVGLLAGLGHYVLFLWTGDRRVPYPVGAAAFALLFLLEYIVAARGLVGVEVGAWRVEGLYLHPMPLDALAAALVLGAGLLVGLLVAYGALSGLPLGAGQRARTLALPVGLLVWGTGVLAMISSQGVLDPAAFMGWNLTTALGIYAVYNHGESFDALRSHGLTWR